MNSNKIIHKPPCIAQFNNKTTHFRNLTCKDTLCFPIALVGQKKGSINSWKQCHNEKWKTPVGEARESKSPLETAIREFYHAFNAKEIEKLKQLLSDEFVYQDFLFYTPFHDQEAINLWRNLMEAMGPNIKIEIDRVSVDNLMVTVFWHLVWNKRKIPFTNGCRFFWFKEVEGEWLISKITGLEELPLKPGELVLNVLRTIRTLMDTYPAVASGLLDTHAFQDGSTSGRSP
ncbi:hypothetical protein Fmac_007607 [Flemingia macrophylla]|uniref:SnoaL-like domain-containing protein n=1 Tax=Flemingia macrophylla TaxID=520843 RepID=A0ABD1MV22_9FABA